MVALILPAAAAPLGPRLSMLVAPSFDVLAQAAVETLRISLPTIMDAAHGRLTSQICDERLDSWSSRLLRQARIQLDVSGHENIVHGEPLVVMSNHQSH